MCVVNRDDSVSSCAEPSQPDDVNDQPLSADVTSPYTSADQRDDEPLSCVEPLPSDVVDTVSEYPSADQPDDLPVSCREPRSDDVPDGVSQYATADQHDVASADEAVDSDHSVSADAGAHDEATVGKTAEECEVESRVADGDVMASEERNRADEDSETKDDEMLTHEGRSDGTEL